MGAGHNTVPCPDGVRKFSLESVPASPASSTLRLLGTRLGEAGKDRPKGMPADAPRPVTYLNPGTRHFCRDMTLAPDPEQDARVGMDWF